MIRKRIKKQAAFLLTASMLMGLSLSVADSISVYADANEDAASKPSLSAYASKGELQSEFNPGSENASIGKLKLGKYNNADIEWYILGRDSGVVDSEGKAIENTAILAASNITGTVAFQSNFKFNEDYTECKYDGSRTISDAKVSYNDEITSPTSFWANHYGLSDVRNRLREMVGVDSSIFSSAELNLMNETKVTTDDLYNTNAGASRYYTTSDKLYLPYGNINVDQEISVGSDNSKTLSRSEYWGTGDRFWLRAPDSLFNGSLEFFADPSWSLTNDGVNIDYNNGVRPASNLNLSSVLFASSVAAAAGSSAESGSAAGAAMRLRLDGADKNIGSVALSGDIIKVIRNSTGETVSLVVQGKTGDTDWYYSEVIEQADEGKKVEIARDTIKDKLGSIGIASEDIDLSSCKIWLEIKDNDDGMLYAVEATKSTAPEECDHKYQFVARITPTKTEPGYKRHYECSRCGKLFMLIAGKHIEVTEADLLIPPTGNSSSSGSGGSSSVSTGWIKDSKGWKYRNSDGTLAKGYTVTDADSNKVEKILWQKAGNGYYAFGSDGYLVTGWIYDKLEDKWYYCDENMGKLYGWYNEPQDGYWYYLSLSTGEALTGWQSINGKDYYFAAPPAAPTYSFDVSTGFWIYSNLNDNRPFGSMYANTVTPDNYTVDASGAWVR